MIDAKRLPGWARWLLHAAYNNGGRYRVEVIREHHGDDLVRRGLAVWSGTAGDHLASVVLTSEGRAAAERDR